MNTYVEVPIPDGVKRQIGAVLPADWRPVSYRLGEKAHTLPSRTGRNDVTQPEVIVCNEPINDLPYINKHHEAVNAQLAVGGVYVSCCEYLEQRHERISERSSLILPGRVLRLWDFLFHRVFQKLSLSRSLYFRITKGKGRPLSRVEVLGRLFSCGFEVLSEIEVDGLHYVISKKVGVPSYDLSPSFSLIFKMQRVGFQGKLISVYKMRTMHAYSEYLQDYMLTSSRFSEIGKIHDDPRITGWGKFMRKFWLDEIPMLINLIKGDLGVVGVRPLSKAMFNKYPSELRELRIQVKPGLIPPFYADIPKGIDGVMESEERYLLSKLKRPVRTDWLYFWKAANNIFFKGARSS